MTDGRFRSSQQLPILERFPMRLISLFLLTFASMASAAIPMYLAIDGIPGSVNVAGREGNIEVLDFEHQIAAKLTSTGTPAGTYTHGTVTFLKAIDKSSPLLFQRVCTGTLIPRLIFRQYEITDQGEERAAFEIVLTNAKVQSVETILSNGFGIKDRQNENAIWGEQVSVFYSKITWIDLRTRAQFTQSYSR